MLGVHLAFADAVNVHQVVFSAIVLVAIALLVTERLRPDLVAVSIIIALYVSGILSATEATTGFSSEPALVIASVFVLSAGFRLTGLSDVLSAWIGRLSGGSLARILLVSMPAAALLSAPTHHVTVTAIMLPVMLALGAERSIPASKLLMPVTIASSLGTTITTLGAPSFLISSQLLQQAGRPGLPILSVAPIGLALTAVGTLFMVMLGRSLLPARQGGRDTSEHFRLEDYFTELAIPADSPYVGRPPNELLAKTGVDLELLGWVREGRRIDPGRGHELAAGDVLLVRARPDELLTVRGAPGVELHPVVQYGIPKPNGHDGAAHADVEDEDVAEQLVQAVVAPGSSLVNRTLSQVDFRRAYGAVVLGFWRNGVVPRDEMAHIRLRPGDVLVLQGTPEALDQLSRDPDFVMLAPFHGQPRRRTKALVAAAIMLGTILLAATDLMSIGLAAIAGATAMVLSRCVTSREAYRAIDAQMYLFIAGAIPLGTAIKKTGTADLIAHWLQGVVHGWGQSLILIAIFATVGLIVQFMGSDSATVALLGPVAIGLAAALGHNPEAYVVTVAVAAITAILTPMSHHNLIIYRPGGYRFVDYVRVGAPLTAAIAVTTALVTPLVFPT